LSQCKKPGCELTSPHVHCNECDLTGHHVHCGRCNFALPSAIVYLEKREPLMGESLKIIPGNYVVRCPSCQDGTLVRVKPRGRVTNTN